MNALITYLEWLLGKWHQNGLHSITREDYVELERAYLTARAHGDDTESAVIEFTEAMNAPRGDAADRRRSEAMRLLRKKHADIQKDREARLNADGRVTN